ncbi:MAG: methyltransferase [Bacteroidetes bacterium]|nr:methyltransferase [Bacteroidota bacterium]
MSFRFRQFEVEDSHSTMKVGTDAMLLGSWVQPSNAESILDVGTGCGVLALMMAQGSGAQIDAIDIHKPSVKEAENNIAKSPWAGRIRVFCRPVEEHACLSGTQYDVIITNPPFFINSLKPDSSKKLIAKHETSLSLTTLLESSLHLMHKGSSLAIILPLAEGLMFTKMANMNGLFLAKRLLVRPLPAKSFHRVLMEFRLVSADEVTEDELTIFSVEGSFSEKYLSMTQNFHLFNQKRP